MLNPTTASTDEFVTSDLGQSAYLLALEFPLLAVRSNGRHAFFVFPAPAREIAQQFFRPGQDLVSARRFHLALRDLRGLAKEAVR